MCIWLKGGFGKNRMQAISKQIRTKLSETGLSVHALEKKAGLRPSAVQNIIYGRSKNPSVETIQAIARAFDCSISELLEDQEASNLSHEEIVAPEKPTINQHYLWNFDLYINTLKKMNDILKKKNINLPKEKTMEIAEEIYNYSLKGNKDNVDYHFAEWLIEKSAKTNP